MCEKETGCVRRKPRCEEKIWVWKDKTRCERRKTDV